MNTDDPYAAAEWAQFEAEQEADRQRKAEPPPAISTEAFLAWRSPRTVQEQATRLDNPLWHWLVRTRHSAWSANKSFAGPSSTQAGPMWCFDRFGMSETVLQGGQTVYIGGEHEDFYDPDFFIYNDVVVASRDGSISIHGYPADVFPPTDFHSATLIGDTILIVGGLGYHDQRRAGVTPVFRLDLRSMHIHAIPTHGDCPGWIFKHSAARSGDGGCIIVSGGQCWVGDKRPACENIDNWSLNLHTGEWQRLTQQDWQRWTVRRDDRRPLRLPQIR